MSVKIRLQRVGKRDQELFRVVALDSRAKRDTKTLGLLGTADMSVKPRRIKLDKNAIDGWIKKGARLNASVQRLISL